MRDKTLRTIQIGLMAAGVALLAFFVAAHTHRWIMSRAVVERFREVEEQRPSSNESRSLPIRDFTFDFSLWSPQRISDYEKSLTAKLAPPIAILRIPKIDLEVPVLDGVDDLTLNRGVGYIPGTARPGERGNLGIAGHRDGFFRALKSVATGDTVELESVDHLDLYRVSQVVIVDKKDTSVLRPTPIPVLTLVTCYPFYFIGSAPKRYIVVASLITSGLPPEVTQPRLAGSPYAASSRTEPESTVAKGKKETPK